MKRNLNAEDVMPIVSWVTFIVKAVTIILLIIGIHYGLVSFLAEVYRNETKHHQIK